MKRINILTSRVSQLVAAGEVAENPASVVKELVENSIDAGAKRIVIEIKSGGTKLIKITDNGHGMYRDDVFDAFARHGTSKIHDMEDITKIGSLGFRGEALASICSVSQLELVTRSKDENLGTKLCINGGEFGQITDAGCAQGTIISVKNLFYNIPARLKFLKSDISEGNKISSLIDKLALSHPEIFFRLIRDGKEVLCTQGDSKISTAIYSVCGREFYENLIEIKHKNDDFEINGYISKPDKCRPGRSIQNFFINGRLVKSKNLSITLEDSFKSLVTLGKKPCCVLYITMPYNMVDVNVHPAKTEVKFANEEEVLRELNTVVTKTLNEYNLETSPVLEFNHNITQKKPEYNFRPVIEPPKSIFTEPAYKNIATKPKLEFNQKDTLSFSYLRTENKIEIKPKSSPIVEKAPNIPNEEKKETEVKVQNIENLLKNNEFSGKILGEVFNCYIIVEHEHKLILIDKHAAHERILFEKIKNQSSEMSSQVLLNPKILRLEKEEYAVIVENLSLLSQAGYNIVDNNKNGEIILKSIPMHENISDIEQSIIEISDHLLRNNKNTNTEKLNWLYNNIACRSAIKSGHKTSTEEIKKLVQTLCENPGLRNCPHGRPIYVEFDKKYIENKFERT